MSESEAIEQLKSLAKSTDNEAAHSRADEILLDFLENNGFPELAKQWELTSDEVGFWYA